MCFTLLSINLCASHDADSNYKMANDSLIPYGQTAPELAESAEAILSRQMTKWEQRGRGWDLSYTPVELEPPFCPLLYLLSVPEMPVFDDGRQPGFWSGLFNNANSVNQTANQAAAIAEYHNQVAEYKQIIEQLNEPAFCQYFYEEFTELQLILPKELKITRQVAESLLLSFSYLSSPVSFEIIGTKPAIVIQFACTQKDALQVKQQISAHLPNCVVKETSDYLADVWTDGDDESLIVDFGLSNEFFLPLKTNSHFETDFLITVIGALSHLKESEVGIFQVLFQKAKNDWGQEIIDSVSYLEESGMYGKSSGAMHLAKEKTRTPLFASCLRVAAKGYSEDRTWHIVKGVSAGLSSFSNPAGNELIPLSNDNYPHEDHEQALLNRQTHRCGMILNLEELVSVAHPPSNHIQSGKLQREMEQTKAAPRIALHNSLILGENYHQSEIREVSLSNEQRTKHLHLIGASGSGKSSLLLNLIKQDLENGQGLCVIDPHGDLIDAVIENMPESRIKETILFDPADAEFPIGFNILKANSELEKTLLSSDLVATFRRMSTSWGDVMDSVLANAILAFVESEKGGTLFDLKRFLVEKDFRSEFLKTVNDEAIRYFWTNEFPLITGKPQSSILIRLDTFLRQKLIRNIVCQKENKIDFRQIMDNKKVLLIKLSQGLIGEENAYLLGTLLVSKIYQTALSRQDSQTRPYFWLYLDEFHHFITPSMESILSGVRKYNIGLHLAHQEFRQLQSRNLEVASSVLSNCYSRICFRLGDTDAEKFASGFSFFDAKSLLNLGIGEAVGRIERADFDFNLTTDLLPKVAKETAEQRRSAVISQSRKTYGTPKAEVETTLFTIQPKPIISEVISDKTTNVVNSDVREPISQIIRTEKQSAENKSEDRAEHRYLQSVIKRVGENYGFVATLEKQVFGGVGKVDVALENEHLKIACEIAVTNTVEYELNNIQKCLASGFDKVVVISADNKHLANIRRKAESVISPLQFSKVHFLEPDSFHLFLESLNNQIRTEQNKQAKVKGYTVKVDFKEQPAPDTETRKQTVFEIVSNLIKRKKK